MEEKIIIEDLLINIERKSIKNMYIRIYPPDGKIKMTVPKHIKIDTVKMFASSRINWIKKQREIMVSKPIKEELQYITGEYHYLWGKRYILEIVEGSANSVDIKDDRLILQTKSGASSEELERLMIEWYREILKAAIPSALEKWTKIVGKSPKEWHVKNMRTRWGTCNPSKKRIWLNLQLVKKPPECLDYVIVHELVHLYVRKHDDEFKAYMDRFYPDWRMVKKGLNQEL
jgi:predicted metal-dependent hydrolase